VPQEEAVGKRLLAGREAPPLPPTSASVSRDGGLKDTPANRALHPRVTPQGVFQNPDLLHHAY
jgi:site-specific DNA-methyltransferase (cytosine-N4-specific)